MANVIWCTGFVEEFSWIELPIFGEDGRPLHERGVVGSSLACTSSGCSSSTRGVVDAPRRREGCGVHREAHCVARTERSADGGRLGRSTPP